MRLLLTNGTEKVLPVGAATMGLRVVAVTFTYEDVTNPRFAEYAATLATRFAPPPSTFHHEEKS